MTVMKLDTITLIDLSQFTIVKYQIKYKNKRYRNNGTVQSKTLQPFLTYMVMNIIGT